MKAFLTCYIITIRKSSSWKIGSTTPMVKMIARTELKFGEDCATIALPASATIFGLRGSTVAPEDAKGFLVVYNIQPLAPPHAKRQTAVVGIETRGGVAGGSAKARPKSAPPFLRRKGPANLKSHRGCGHPAISSTRKLSRRKVCRSVCIDGASNHAI